MIILKSPPTDIQVIDKMVESVPPNICSVVVTPKMAVFLQLSPSFYFMSSPPRYIIEYDSTPTLIGRFARENGPDVNIYSIFSEDGTEYMRLEDGTRIAQIDVNFLNINHNNRYIIEDGSIEKFDRPVANSDFGQGVRFTITDNRDLTVSFGTPWFPVNDKLKLADALEDFVSMLRSKSIPDNDIF